MGTSVRVMLCPSKGGQLISVMVCKLQTIKVRIKLCPRVRYESYIIFRVELVHGWHGSSFGKAETKQATKSHPWQHQHGMIVGDLRSPNQSFRIL